MVSFGDNADLLIRSLPDETIFHVSRKELAQHSSVFSDMFACCDGSDPKQVQEIELDEPASVLEALLRLIYDPPSYPVMSKFLKTDDETSDNEEIYLIPKTSDPAAAIPCPILPLLYSLIDKYDLSKAIEQSLDAHLLIHIPMEPLRVYAYATAMNKDKIASTASEYVLPLASYTVLDVQAIGSVAAYHKIVILQHGRVRALRDVLLKEDLFPHDYGKCNHHGTDARLHWEAQKLQVIGKIQSNTDVAEEMYLVSESLKSCPTCQKACIAALDMLRYKCAKVPKRLDQIQERIRE